MAEQKKPDGVLVGGSYNKLYASGEEDSLFAFSSRCPSCKKPIITLVHGKIEEDGQYNEFYLVYPRHIERFVPPEVPSDITEDFIEAVAVLSISQKASAALSRRCLQNVLIDKGANSRKNLSEQIGDTLPSLPTYIAEDLDAIRNLGNFAAHPIKYTNSSQIVDVEPGEAEWNLDVLEELFDFYYVKPAISEQKRAILNAKLQAAGKRPMKKP